jgi:hypothetical protein
LKIKRPVELVFDPAVLSGFSNSVMASGKLQIVTHNPSFFTSSDHHFVLTKIPKRADHDHEKVKMQSQVSSQ